MSATVNRRRRPWVAAAVVLTMGLIATTLLVARQRASNEAVARARFERLSDQAVASVERRVHLYEYGLRGARGAVVAQHPKRIDREAFLAYSRTRDIDHEFPGARGMGVIWRVPQHGEAAFVDAARANGMPNFTVSELTPHDAERFVIEYIEPAWRNREAIGLDIGSEARRRHAAEQAMREGHATLTAPITLVQATGQPLQSFLLLLPIYPPHVPLNRPDEREAACVGWSYAPLVMSEVLADLDLGQEVAVSLRDAETADEPAFFAAGAPTPALAHLGARRHLEVFGRTWWVELEPTRSFAKSLGLLSPQTVGSIGALVAFLFSGLAYLVSRSRERESSLRAEQALRATIVDGSPDAIIGEDLDGHVVSWNRGAERLFGYAADEAIGKSTAELIVPPDDDDDQTLRRAVENGREVVAYETIRRHKDGALIDVSVAASSLRVDERGQRFFSKTLRDIRRTKDAEREIRELNEVLEDQVEARTEELNATVWDLENILDALPSLVSYWDRDLRNRFANQAYEDWFGIDPTDLPGKTLEEAFGDRAVALRSHFEAVLSGERQSVERDFIDVNGELKHVMMHLIPDTHDDGVHGFYVIATDVTSQARAYAELAQALRDNEALLGTINELAIVSVTDRRGILLEVNDAFCDISGYSADELIGKSHAVINSGHHSHAFWVDMWRTIATGKPWRGVVCNRKKDGELYWVDSIIAPFIGDDGKVERYVSIRFDITDRYRIEHELQLTHERVALATDAAGIGIWDYDLAAGSLLWDGWMHRLYGYPEGIDSPYDLWARCLHPEDRERAEAELQAAIDGGPAFDTEFRIVRGDGEVRHLKAVAQITRGADGRALRMTGINLDITDRKRSEIERAETASLLQSILGAATDTSVVATDPDLKITVFNSGAEKLLGYRAEEMIGMHDPSVFHDPSEVAARAAELSAQAGEPVVGGAAFVHPLALNVPREWTYVRKGGERVPVSLVVTPIMRNDGEKFGYLGVAHDISRLKEHEATLQDARDKAERANLIKGQFLANMSHEIRTPMNAVLGLAYILGQTALDADQASLLSKMQTASKTLLALINDVLDMSKIDAGELSVEELPFDLRRAVTDACDVHRMQFESKGVELITVVASDVPQGIVGDTTRFAQVLNNLLSNALKFTERGSVTISLAVEAREDDVVSLALDVTDTGIGIAPNVQAKLFQPFVQADASTTRRFGGTGLGLSIIKRLVEMMGGTISLTSAPGVGSTFHVRLRARVAKLESLKTGIVLLETAALDGVRALVVDDSEVNIIVAKRMLEHQDATVSTACNGREAVDRLEAGPDDFDIVLMDVQMPVLDGRQATQEIRGRLGLDIPIIALTAEIRASERRRALESGMDDFVSKPFELTELLRVMQRHLPRAVFASLRPANDNATEWPRLNHIDVATARRRLSDDLDLFKSLFARFVDEYTHAPRDEGSLVGLAARLHKLKGAAGALGATTLHELATRAETECRRDMSPDALLVEMDRELESLRREAASVLPTPPRQAAATTPPAVVDWSAIDDLLRLVEAQDFDAVAKGQALSAMLVAALGSASAALLADELLALDFVGAAARLRAARPEDDRAHA